MTAVLDWTYLALVIVIGALVRVLLIVAVLAVLVTPVVVAAEAWPHVAGLYRRLRGRALVEGLDWREGDYYSPSHTWLRRGLGHGLTVGLDALAADLVPWAHSVALPQPGASVHRGEVVAELQADGRCAQIVSPVDGTIARVNEDLAHDPGIALRDPYGRGWLFTVTPTGTWRQGLRHGPAAREWFALEARLLARMLERDLGLAGADGGRLVAPVLALVSDEGWQALSRTFLRAA